MNHWTKLSIEYANQRSYLDDLFPIKDSYVAYLKRDKESLKRNPATADRLCGRFNGKYVIGEAKFLTDFGGHQNAQFNDAIATIKAKNVKAIKIAILDGVLYIKGKNKMYKDITGKLKEKNIISALVLREFLYQL